MKRLIAYDLDGTLVDTLEDIAVAANHMLRVLQAPAVPPHEVRRYVGRGVHQLVSGCLKADDPKRIEYGVSVFRAYYARHLLDHSRLYPGARAVLEHFRERDQAVITNKPNPFASQILEALGVAGYLCEVIAGDAGYPKKPDPEALCSLMAKRQVAPGETVVIGDSPIDMEAGRRAGALTVAIAHGLTDEEELVLAAPDALVKDFEGLLELAKRDAW